MCDGTTQKEDTLWNSFNEITIFRCLGEKCLPSVANWSSSTKDVKFEGVVALLVFYRVCGFWPIFVCVCVRDFLKLKIVKN